MPYQGKHLLHTGVDEQMETKLARITEIAKMKPNEKFTSLYHHINEEMLLLCHTELSGNKASGVDRVTKEEYETNLVANIKDLVNRLKSHSYRPLPVLRVYIDKAGTNKKRPLGIPAYEDKLVQKALAKILNAIYEADFLDCSFGFRPNRGCHERLTKFNLEIAEDKTKIIRFGRYATHLSHLEGKGKPGTFDFLGFTHYCGKSRKGKFRVKRKTSRKKYKASLLKVEDWLKVNRHLPAKELMTKLRRKLEGYYNYYAITDNGIMVDRFHNKVKGFVFKWLNRRSQRRSFNWGMYQLFLNIYPYPGLKSA